MCVSRRGGGGGFTHKSLAQKTYFPPSFPFPPVPTACFFAFHPTTFCFLCRWVLDSTERKLCAQKYKPPIKICSTNTHIQLVGRWQFQRDTAQNASVCRSPSCVSRQAVITCDRNTSTRDRLTHECVPRVSYKYVISIHVRSEHKIAAASEA